MTTRYVIDKKRLGIFIGSFTVMLLMLFLVFQAIWGKGLFSSGAKDYKKEIGEPQLISTLAKASNISGVYPKIGNEFIDGIIVKKVSSITNKFDGGKAGKWDSLAMDYNSFSFDKDKTGVVIIATKKSKDGKRISTGYYPYTFSMQQQKQLTLAEAMGQDKIKAVSAQAYQASLMMLDIGGVESSGIIEDFSEKAMASRKNFTMDKDGITFYSNNGSEVLPVSNKSIDLALVDSTVLDMNKPPAPAENADRLAGIDKSKPIVAITFDDGPHKILTPRMLKILKDNNAVATFFMLGSNVQRNPKIVKEMYENGNEIGSHTWKHDMLTRMTKDQIRRDLARTNKALVKATGSKATVFRPTYGAYNASVLKAMSEPAILWSVDPQDWKYRNTNYVAKHIIKNAKDGDIILLHDIHPTSIPAAEKAIKALSKKGYQFVTVSELAKIKGKKLKVGNKYSQIR